jgi:hypothetical protein
MRFCLSVVVFALLLPGFSSGFSQEQSEPQRVRSFTEVKGLLFEEPSKVEFYASGYKYIVSNNGRGRREGRQEPVRNFNLRLYQTDFLARLYHEEYKDDLLLICEFSDSESGAGFITRLDGRTLRMKWKRSIPAFNIGQGLIEDNFAYVTAIGFVGKVNLETGVYAWKHAGLYRTKREKGSAYSDADFNSFELPKIEQDVVLFKEVEIYPLPFKTLKIQKRSGRIISKSVLNGQKPSANERVLLTRSLR